MTERGADLLVVGGGVFGLWVARRALQAGLSVRLVEARRIGAGASGGLLGALTAHTPDRWSEKKAFQLAALAELPNEIAALEAETGLSTGYGRVGRAMPIRSEAFAAQIAERAAGARAHWAPRDPGFVYEARSLGAPRDPVARGWMAPEAAPLGFIWDGLAARVVPRAYGAALAAALRARATLCEGVRYVGFENGRARLSDGSDPAVGAVVLAAGFESFALHPALARAAAPGGGVKGRSAAFAAPGWDGAPLLYEDGIYVLAHADGTVAVGSTDEKDWAAPGEDAYAAGARVEGPRAFLERAAALCPPLRGREPTALWAGVRPKTRARDPILGPIDAAAPIHVASGGFKIGFGIAHRIAAALIDRLTGARDPTLAPARFWTEAQLGAGGG